MIIGTSLDYKRRERYEDAYSTDGTVSCIGVGARSAGPVLAGLLFQRFNTIRYRYLRARRCRRRAIRARLLQPNHFNRPGLDRTGRIFFFFLDALST